MINLLLEISPILPDGSIKTLHLSSANVGPSGTQFDDGYQWFPIITQQPTRSISWSDEGVLGETTTSYTPVVFEVSPEFGLENTHWSNWQWQGANCRIWRGEEGQPFSAYTQIYEGSAGAIERSGNLVTLPLLSIDHLVDRNLLSRTYAGTSPAGGPEGPSALRGVLKPFAAGVCANVEAILVDRVAMIYQYHGYGPTKAVTAIYENALTLGAPAATATTWSELAALTLQDGTWAAAPAIGAFRIANQPTGKITADVSGAMDGETFPTTVGTIMAMLIRQTGVPADRVAASLRNRPEAWSLYTSDQTIVGDELRAALLACGCAAMPSPDGKFSALDFYDLNPSRLPLNGEADNLPLVRSYRQLNVAPPIWQVKVSGERCWSTHSEQEISQAVAIISADLEAKAAEIEDAKKVADQAQAAANVQARRVDDILADDILDRGEKKRENDTFENEGAIKVELMNKSTSFDVTAERANYLSAYNNLALYLSSLRPSFFDLTQSTPIDLNYNAFWKAYEVAKVTLTNAMTGDASRTAIYDSVSGTPEFLADINPEEGVKLGGIEAGADVTGDNTSKDTQNVGGRPAGQIVQQIDLLPTIRQDINTALAAAQAQADKEYAAETPPGAVSGLSWSSALTDAGADITLTWNAVADANNYQVEVTENGSNAVVFPIGGTVWRSAAKRNTAYSARVRALKGNVPGAWTSAGQYSTGRDTVAPAAPIELAVTPTFNGATVTVAAPADADQAKIQINLCRASDGLVVNFKKFDATASTRSTQIFENLDRATNYFVVALAYDSSDNASPSTAQVFFTTSGGIPASDFAPDISAIKNVTSLPLYPTDTETVRFGGELYNWVNGAWSKAVKAVDIVGQLPANLTVAGVGGDNSLVAAFSRADYNQTVNKPTSLGQINPEESDKLVNIKPFAGSISDTRGTDHPPSHYYALGRGERQEFKDANFGGSGSSGYGHLITITQWADVSGGPVKQTLTDAAGVIFERLSYAGDVWGSWGRNYNSNSKPALGSDLVTSAGQLLTDGNTLNQHQQWVEVGGSGKPQDNATVGAIAGVNLQDSNGVALADNDIRNNTDTSIRNPGGGTFTTTTATVTGAIKITLPQFYVNTMMKFVVDIYEYENNYSCTLDIAGYNYSANNQWYSTSARVIGGSNVEYPVRYGDDDSRCVIWIGDPNSSWTYPQVRVRDFFAGYASNTRAQWDSGWTISFDTAAPTNVSSVILDTYPAADWRKVTGAGRPQDYATVGAPAGTAIGSTAAETVEARANDPATRINQTTTTIDGGKITTGSITANQIAVGTISADKIGAGQITTDKLLVKAAGSTLNVDPNFVDPSVWRVAEVGGASLVVVSDGKIGNTALQLTTVNSSIVPVDWINLNRDKTYRFQVWARRASGNHGNIYAGVCLSDKSGTNLNGDGTYWLYVASGYNVGSEWQLFEGVFGAGTARTFPAHATQMSINLFGNYNDGIAPSNSAHQFQDVRIEEVIPGTLIKDGAITTDKVAANSINASKIATRTITADLVASGTLTANEIAGGTITGDKIAGRTITADKITSRSIGANEIVAGSLTALEIAGRTITADKIAAGTLTANEIAANSITTNKLTAATRPVALVGCNIRYENGMVRWDAGYINFVHSDGQTVTRAIAAGAIYASASPETPMFLQYSMTELKNSLDYNNDKSYFGSSDWKQIATWYGGANLAIHSGVGTILNGDQIVTGSIDANKIVAGSITAGQIAAGAITADKLLIGSLTQLNPDPGFRDLSFWINHGVFNGSLSRDPNLGGWYNTHGADVNAAFGTTQYAMLWEASSNPPGSGRQHLSSQRRKNIKGGAKYQLSATVRNASNQVIYVYVRMYNVDSVYVTDFALQWTPGEIDKKSIQFTTPPDVNSYEFIVFNLSGTIFSGYCQVTGLQVSELVGATRIENGAITTDKIAANAVTANQLTVASRPFTIFGCQFYVDVNNYLQWTNGYVQFINSSGVYNSLYVTAGTRAPVSAVQYIYYNPGATTFETTTDETIQGNQGVFAVGKWHNGKSGLILSGGVGTLINGDAILTGTINADRIQSRTIGAEQIGAGAITANEISAGTIGADQIAANAIVASKLAIGSTDSIIPDSNFYDRKFWTNGADDARVQPYSGIGFSTFNRCIAIAPNGGIDTTSMFFPVQPGATYRIETSVYLDVAFNGSFRAVIHQPGVRWFGLRNGGGIDPSDASDGVAFNTPGLTYGHAYTLTNASNLECREWQFRFTGSWTGTAFFACRIVRVSDTTLIQDGAITTDKITVGTLNGDRITASTINGDKLIANTIDASKIVVGSIGTDRMTADLQAKSLRNIANVGFWGKTSINGNPGWSENNASANAWHNGISPTGGTELMLRMTANSNNNANGGWDYAVYPADGWSKENTYRYYTWVYAEAFGDNSLYHGTGNVDYCGTNNSAPNPYFMSFSKSNIARDKWYLMVGLVHGAGSYHPDSGQSGLYDPVSGQRVIAGSDFKWSQNAAYGSFRSYQYYGSVDGKAYFTKPVIEQVVSGQTASIKSLMQTLDYGTNINTGSTQILPGMINISGGTTLASWRQGGDDTKIAGGSISANTITSNKLTVGNRNISIDGISFQYNRDNGLLTWTEGNIFFNDDNNNSTYTSILAGSSGWGGGNIRYISWKRGNNFLDQGTDNWSSIFSDPDRILLCTWRNGPVFTATYGATIVDGDRITTGSINADRITAGTVLASSVVIGGTGTSVSQVVSTANTANSTANTAASNASSALSKIADIGNDDILTKGEKSALIITWQDIDKRFVSARDVSLTLNNNFGTDFTASDRNNASYHYNAASGYLVSLSPYWSDVTTDSPVNGNHLRDLITNIYSAIGALEAANTNHAAVRSQWSGVAGGGKPEDGATVGAILGSNMRDTSGYTLASGDLRNNQDGIIRNPGGGFRASTANVETGAICVQLPVGWSSTMIKFTVDIYEYEAGYSCSMEIAGYNYDQGYWVNCTARVMGGSNVEYPVRFGVTPDGAKCAVYIGDAGTSWSYPQIRVKDVMLGYANYSRTMWENGWNIFMATPYAVSVTIADTLPGADYSKGKNNPQSLAAINGTEGAKLGGIETNATRGAPAGTLVGNTDAQTVTNWAYDPASRVNNFSTTISGGKITTGSITAAQIQALSITGDRIAANTIDAGRLSVGSLSAISANIGEVTAGVIRSASGATNLNLNNGRLEFAASGFRLVEGAGIGPAGNMVLWYGPTWVGSGGETLANSRFALGTDGKVYYGAVEIGGSSSDNGVKLNGSVTAYTTSSTPVNSAMTSAAGKFRVSLSGTAGVIDNYGGGGNAIIQVIVYLGGVSVFQGSVVIPTDGNSPDYSGLTDAFNNIVNVGADPVFTVSTNKLGGGSAASGSFTLRYVVERVGN